MSQNRIVIQKITLECITVKSNKFYDVSLVVEDDTLKWESEYGVIGSSPKKGVSGSLELTNVCQLVGSRDFEVAVASLVSEANKVVHSKVKKGYTSQSKSLNTFDCLKNIYAHFPTGPVQKAAVTANNPPALNSFEVEVIGIDWPRLKIAKVLENFDYDVLGEVLAGQSTSHRIGDTIRVTKTDTGYALA